MALARKPEVDGQSSTKFPGSCHPAVPAVTHPTMTCAPQLKTATTSTMTTPLPVEPTANDVLTESAAMNASLATRLSPRTAPSAQGLTA